SCERHSLFLRQNNRDQPPITAKTAETNGHTYNSVPYSQGDLSSCPLPSFSPHPTPVARLSDYFSTHCGYAHTWIAGPAPSSLEDDAGAFTDAESACAQNAAAKIAH